MKNPLLTTIAIVFFINLHQCCWNNLLAQRNISINCCLDETF